MSKKKTYLKDYTPPAYLILSVHLTFTLGKTKTTCFSSMQIERVKNGDPLVLQGKDLVLKSLKINGKDLSKEEYLLDGESLTLFCNEERFLLEIETECNPSENTSLEGLYLSDTILCTQNEPHGFSKITYFLDRPDVLSRYKVTMIAEKKSTPVLLSNGNLIESGDLPEGRHFAVYEDPFNKPCYLFALVAGDLGFIQDSFKTMSGRDIDLLIYCDHGNEEKCAFAMESLKKAMKWDETVYGLEYDLDRFVIVAVDSFNFGAMENKGLNIFNTSCTLCDSKSATDQNFLRVETVIAHEYFHNWTGNRVTVRNWFELTLKEGLTVFRDQEFSADMHNRPLKRIEDVALLRKAQFAEDKSPLSHPIKPSSYLEVNNFYTSTIYNKGAEIIRMLKLLLGEELYYKGIKNYFALFDGQAVSTDDFIFAFEQVSGKDLSHFKKWYLQKGTPLVLASWHYDKSQKVWSLTLKQHSTKDEEENDIGPLLFPFVLSLIGKEGGTLPFVFQGEQREEAIIHVTKEEETFLFHEVEKEPIPSLNRSFSAPIELKAPYSIDELSFLSEHDTDLFHRFDCFQEMSLRFFEKALAENSDALPTQLAGSFQALLQQDLDPMFQAEMLELPSLERIGDRFSVIDFDRIAFLRTRWMETLSKMHRKTLELKIESLREKEHSLTHEAISKRALKHCFLRYISTIEDEKAINLCIEEYRKAISMTDAFYALYNLVSLKTYFPKEELTSFYNSWKHDPLVLNKYFQLLASSKHPLLLPLIEEAAKDPLFSYKVPNNVRSLFGSFGKNLVQFHRKDGEGYALIRRAIVHIDPINPSSAASLATLFMIAPKTDEKRKALIKQEIERMLTIETLSPNVFEILNKALNSLTQSPSLCRG